MTPSEAARTHALCVPEPGRVTLRVSGKDRADWLNGLLTCDTAKVVPGRGALGLFLTKTGKILTDVYLVASTDALYLGVNGPKAEEIHAALDKMLVMEDAELEVRKDLGWYTLHGPIASEAVSEIDADAAGSIDFTGLGGAACVLSQPIQNLPLNVVLGTEADWLALRIEKGFPLYGVDYGSEDNPHEASLDQLAVSWDKGCYLGQEVVYMQGKRGRVKRHVVTLALEGDAVPAVGEPVTDAEGKPAGSVTSAARSDALGGPVVLARLNGEPSPPLRVQGSVARIVERGAAA
jgi:tRNA-modifying protein YgfZ